MPIVASLKLQLSVRAWAPIPFVLLIAVWTPTFAFGQQYEINRLGSADPVQRAAAILALGKLGPEALPAVPKLLELLDDQAAVMMLARTGGFGPTPIGSLAKDAPLKIRPSDLSLLTSRRDWRESSRDAPWILRSRLFSEAYTRRIGTPLTNAFIARHARDPNPVVRERTANALRYIRGDSAEGVLHMLLADPVARVRHAAVSALGDIDAAASLSRIISLLDDESEDVRFAILRTMRSAPRDAVVLVLQGLAESQPPVAPTAIRQLAFYADSSAIAFILERLTSENPALRAACAFSLWKLGARSTVLALVAALQVEPVSTVQLELIESLGQLGDPRAAHVLGRLWLPYLWWVVPLPRCSSPCAA